MGQSQGIRLPLSPVARQLTFAESDPEGPSAPDRDPQQPDRDDLPEVRWSGRRNEFHVWWTASGVPAFVRLGRLCPEHGSRLRAALVLCRPLGVFRRRTLTPAIEKPTDRTRMKPRQNHRPTDRKRDAPFRPGAEEQRLVSTFVNLGREDQAVGWLLRELQSTPALWAYAQEKREIERRRRR
jgi:hypothetical protein